MSQAKCVISVPYADLKPGDLFVFDFDYFGNDNVRFHWAGAKIDNSHYLIIECPKTESKMRGTIQEFYDNNMMTFQLFLEQ